MPERELEAAQQLETLEDGDNSGYVALFSLGGTDAGAILGLNRYKNNVDVWHRLYYLRHGMTEDMVQADNPRMARGRLAEPVIRNMWRERHSDLQLEEPRTFHCDRLGFPRHASVDGVVGPARPSLAGFEAKCMGESTFATTLRQGLDHSYYAQVQHYMSVTGWDWFAYAVLNGDAWEGPNFDPEEHLHTFVVDRNPTFIELMEAAEREFWMEFVEEEVQPAPIYEASPQVRALVPPVGREGEDWSHRQDVRDLVEKKARLDEEIRILNHQKKQVEDTIKEKLGDTQLVLLGGLRVSYKWSVSRTFPQSSRAALQEDHPEIDLSQYENVSRSRSLRVSGRDR